MLNQGGDLVGIPVGRMQGDYRFSFILPLRQEMFRKVPELLGEPASTPSGVSGTATPVGDGLTADATLVGADR